MKKTKFLLCVVVMLLLLVCSSFTYYNSDTKKISFFKNNIVSAQPSGIVQVTNTGGSLLGIPRRKMVIDENDPHKIWIFHTGEADSYYSSDAGSTWTGIDFFSVGDHDSFDIDSSGNIHAGIRVGSGVSDYKRINSPATQVSDYISSNDETFYHFSDNNTASAVLTHGNNVFMITRASYKPTVYYDYSSNGGITWSSSGIVDTGFMTDYPTIRVGAIVVNNVPYAFIWEPASPDRIFFYSWNGVSFVEDTDFYLDLEIHHEMTRIFSVTYTDDGRVHVVYWDDTTPFVAGAARLRHVYKTKAESSWNGPFTVDDCYDNECMISITSHGNDIYAAYPRLDGGINALTYKKFDSSTSTWGSRVVLYDSAGTGDPAFPKKVPASSDFIPLAWNSGGGIYYYAIPATSAPITVDSNFDGARIENPVVEGNTVNFSLFNDLGSYYYWFNFKVSNVAGKTVTFNILNAGGSPFFSSGEFGPFNYVVYSCDNGATWNRITNRVYTSSIYTFTQTFSCNEAQIATFFPFSYTDMQNYVTSISSSSYVDREIIGTSDEGRNIDYINLTNSAVSNSGKKHVFIISRQHAQELPSSFFLKGMLDFLISSDPIAVSMRDRFVFHIIPMMNPDGVYNGFTRADSDGSNMNRLWDTSISQEVNLAKAKIAQVNSSYGIDLFMDWHGQIWDSTESYLIFEQTGYPINYDFYSNLSYFTNIDNYGYGTSSYLTDTNISARYYLDKGINSMTLEPSPHYMTNTPSFVLWTINDLLQNGVGIAYTFDAVFQDTLICPDANNDGKVNIKDLAITIFNQGRNALDPNYTHLDFDESGGTINWDDVNRVIGGFGTTCLDYKGLIRYDGNPVFKRNVSNSWESLLVVHPILLKYLNGSAYHDSNGYWMYYTGGMYDSGVVSLDQMGLARSQDLINWQRVQNIPVLPIGSVGSYDHGDTQTGTVLYNGTTFLLWYSSNQYNYSESQIAVPMGDNVSISFATSNDGINWDKYPSNPIFKQGPLDDRGDMYLPVVMYDLGVWKMWYSGHVQSPSTIGVMYATAPNPYGPWTRYSDSCVFHPWSNVFAQEVWKENNVYYMTYLNWTLPANPINIRWANSSDGISWQDQGVFFNVEVGSNWEDDIVYQPSQVFVGGTWYTFYAGANENIPDWSIGFATSSERNPFI